MNVQPYHYERKAIQSGILHIGVGNFHRAHQAFYTHLLLAEADQNSWGICGACLLPSDEKIVKSLRAQQLDYTLTVCGRDGNDEIHQIGALQELIWAAEDPGALIHKIADPAVKIITLTITEGGYNLDKVTNRFILDQENIKHDLENKDRPATVFGFIAAGLRLRSAEGNGGITILSCDNLQHNGNTAKHAFTSFIQAQDETLARWVAANVTFPNSMVDRITPATTAADVQRLNEKSGINDHAPVYCEDFIQWVIEDDFIAGRPAWERVGVEFTKDVTAFENMKLSLLNAAHTLLSYPSFLMGYRKVDEAMGDADVVSLVRDFMDTDITPHVPAPEGIDLTVYKQTLIERFANHAVSDQLSRLCFDGLSKFPVYIIPNLIKMIKSGQELTRVAFLVAAYRHYLKYSTDDQGMSYEIAEPWLTLTEKPYITADDPVVFLDLPVFKPAGLAETKAFIKLYLQFVTRIKAEGTAAVLKSIVA